MSNASLKYVAEVYVGDFRGRDIGFRNGCFDRSGTELGGRDCKEGAIKLSVDPVLAFRVESYDAVRTLPVGVRAALSIYASWISFRTGLVVLK